MYKLFPTYVLGHENYIIRLTDNATIPKDEGNTDYQKYLKWLDGYEWNGMQYVKTSEGNTPEPADLPPPPDYSVMRLQAYRDESDPLFFKYQRGEIDKQVWLDKVEEIKNRWPD
jgi:hypothetical protein